MPQLLALLRMNKIRDIEAYWIAATLWNKALDHYAFEPFYPKCHFIFPAAEFRFGRVRAGDMMNCNKWSQHAIAVSPFAEDDGVLERTVAIAFSLFCGINGV